MLNEIQLANTDWPYAKLSSLAKSMGGPETMIENIQESSRALGRADMIPVTIGASIITGIIAATMTALVIRHTNKKRRIISNNKETLLGA